MIELKSYGLESSQGPYLNLNEDLVEVDLSNRLFILIDGIGGSNIGDVAARSTKDCLIKSFTKISGDPDSTLPFYYNHKYLLETNALINSLFLAHQKLMKENESLAVSKRGAASVFAVALSDNALSVVSTGNCSGFLFRNKKLIAEILPDSLSTFTGINDNGHGMIPLSGIGIFETLNYFVREFKVHESDTFLFCTDGCAPFILRDKFESIIISNERRELKAIREIFGAANKLGNMDNQSAIILQF